MNGGKVSPRQGEAGMKLGIIGAGAVGAAVALAVCERGHACEVVLIDRDEKRAKGVATDLLYGVPLSPLVDVKAGGYDELAGADLAIVTAGINEKAGGATDRNDPLGRLRLLETNVGVMEDIIPKIVAVAPDAVILMVTNPPEPLVEIARDLAGHDRVMSTSTFLDTLRFRVHLAQFFNISPAILNCYVIGEHGTFSVFLWSSARIGGTALVELLKRRGIDFEGFRKRIEDEVRYANITIIEGIGASQYGIGMVTARVAEIVLRDERAIIPVGSHDPDRGITLSIPSVVGRHGVVEMLCPDLSGEEREGLERTVERLKEMRSRYTVAR